MIRRTRSLLTGIAFAGLCAAILAAPAGAAVASPHFRIVSTAAPTHLLPGDDTGADGYTVVVTNTGAAPTDGSPITIADTLPTGFSVHPGEIYLGQGASFRANRYHSGKNVGACDPGPPATCVVSVTLTPGDSIQVELPVDADVAPPTPAVNQASVSGGGVAPAAGCDPGVAACTVETTPVSATPPAAGFQSSSASLSGPDGLPVTQAGSHPDALRIGFQLNTSYDDADDLPTPLATPRDLTTTLPRGLVLNPQATPVLCTEAQLETATRPSGSESACPAASQVGVVHAHNDFPGYVNELFNDALVNMVPAPGSPGVFASSIAGLGFYVHIFGRVDSAGDYALAGDAPALPQFKSTSGADVEFWGDPSSSSHDGNRGACLVNTSGQTSCPVAPQSTPFITMPGACSAGPLLTHMSIIPWEQNQSPYSTDIPFTDDQGNAQPVTDCDQLAFAPTLSAHPTTNVADSPSGLDVDLHVPQTDSLDQRATANLKKAVVALPEGITVNPSSANGLGACSSSQIGLSTPIGQTPIHFSADHPSCPDAAKIGTVEVDTPLLDAPIQGSVYLAKPFDNPFGSFLAIYIVVDDPQTGVVIKLAGHVVSDPGTGQLVTTFDDNPQLPFSDFKLSFFGGATGTLRTPSACGNYSTTSELTPWSSPTPVDPSPDTYAISQAPSGGSCAAPEDQPNAPSFDAGTISPLAGTYSTFVLNLDRADGTQQFSKITLSPPPGFTAKLAGTSQCSEAQIAQAQGRDQAGDGATEQSDPSCPATSQIGTVNVAAGAGPSPYWAQGKVYLAGPYKGAPLSVAVIAPAVAGPFDLGVVVTRAAASIDPSTAQITTTSDAIPDHLTVNGNRFDLDVRSVRLKLDKPNFSLNGTSCDPTSIDGSLLSTLGQTASLSQPFQLAECANLGFKPSLALRLQGGTLRNGHPALTSTLTYPTGEYANLRKAQVVLPSTMQLDQSHIQAPCTRPQFAAHQCPDASVIGSVTATSPLLDYDLTGPVYLRTGNNPLPDVVLALHGPASQPIEIDQVGKIDTVNARLRTTFEGVPDAPLSKAVISLVGGSKGLLVNNTNLCKKTNRATVLLDGQNSKIADSTPKMAIKCPKPHKRHHKRHRRHHQRHSAR